jgi:CO/xanthine dehydrogenase FAD-binding subunit
MCFEAVDCNKPFMSGKLERHRLVHFAALQAAGTVHIRVVGIHEAAFGAAEHAVFRVRRAEPAAAHFGINPQAAQRAEQTRHIKDDEPGSGHQVRRES